MSRHRKSDRPKILRQVPSRDEWLRGYWLRLAKAVAYAVMIIGAAMEISAVAGVPLGGSARVCAVVAGIGAAPLLVGGWAFLRLRRAVRAVDYPYRTWFGDWGWDSPMAMHLGLPMIPVIAIFWSVCAVLIACGATADTDPSTPGWGWAAVPWLGWGLLIFLAPTLGYHRWPGRSDEARLAYQTRA